MEIRVNMNLSQYPAAYEFFSQQKARCTGAVGTLGGFSVTLLERQATRYRFPAVTYRELRNERLVTFLWGFAIAVVPLLINFLIYKIPTAWDQIQLARYFADNIPAATFTSFSVAALALTNSYFNNAKPVGHGKLSIRTHVCIFAIATLALINFTIHVICSVTTLKEPLLFYLAITMTASISLISWILQVWYVKDITYRLPRRRFRRN